MMNSSVSSERTSVSVTAAPEIAFDEPWQAEAFATAIQLSRVGIFTWPEWVEAFSGTIAREPVRRGDAPGDAYYRQWMSTLETMLGKTVCLTDEVVTVRQALWHSAYLNTRHGEPVLLCNAKTPSASHEHGHERHHHHHHSHDASNVPRPVPRPAKVIPARKWGTMQLDQQC